jgi:hypothetical protein
VICVRSRTQDASAGGRQPIGPYGSRREIDLARRRGGESHEALDQRDHAIRVARLQSRRWIIRDVESSAGVLKTARRRSRE